MPNRTSQADYRKKRYSGPRKCRKRVNSALKRFYGEGVRRCDVWRREVQSLSHMKCVKCGSTNETDTTLSFYRFPCPDLEGNGTSAVRCRAWAEYCWPDRVLTSEELMNVYKENQMVCSNHFPDSETVKLYGFQPGVPVDFPGIKADPVVRTYGKKVEAKEETVSRITAEKQVASKHYVPKTRKKLGTAKVYLKGEKKIPEHDFLEGENGAELFETIIDEVFQGGTEADACQDETNVLQNETDFIQDGTHFFQDDNDVSLYETTVKKEPELEENCDKLLHKGYKCDLCLSSISGYRYTCVQCEDVDLCAACEASGAHDAHYVLRVPRPRPEEEIDELLTELRQILKKRLPVPADQPDEKTKTPSNCASVGEDPLEAAPASPGARSEGQSESDDETTDSESENDSLLKHRSHNEPPPVLDTPPKDLNLRARKTAASKENEISPKRRKLKPDKIAINSTITRSKVVKQVGKSDNLDTYENSDIAEESIEIKREAENLDNALKKALEATKLKAALSLKTDIESLDTDKNDFVTTIENNLRIGDQSVELVKNEPTDKYDEISELEQDKLVHNNIRIARQEGLNTQHLQETLDEEPLDFILQKNFNENDP